jgi:hypothetical protein
MCYYHYNSITESFEIVDNSISVYAGVGGPETNGSTTLRMKYSWKRSSFVNSGWKVVSIKWPCLNATIALGSSSVAGDPSS